MEMKQKAGRIANDCHFGDLEGENVVHRFMPIQKSLCSV